MSDSIIVSKSCYDDFSCPSAWRNFQLLVEEKSLWVNAGWLAELSPFFAHYCFGEEEHTQLFVDDIPYAEMLEFLRCVFYCPMRKPLSPHNVSLILRIATRFEMRPVVARCELFIDRTAKTLDHNKLSQVACAVSHCDPNSTTMSLLVDRMASMKDEDLSLMQFDKMPGDVVADVYTQRLKVTRDKKERKKGCCIL